MKLASALAERADLQRRIAELSVRLNNNAKVLSIQERRFYGIIYKYV